MGNYLSNPNEKKFGGGGPPRPREPLKYNPVQYIPDQETVLNPSQIVSQIHFVAETVLQNGGNHWIINLQISSQEFVRINMHPGELLGAPSPGHGYRGHLELTYRGDTDVSNQQCCVNVPTTAPHPVAHFVNAIIQVGNHEYDFTTEGRGCTGWILDQFSLFQQQGLIPPELGFLKTAVNMQWEGGKPTNDWPTTRGFYMRETRGGGWSSSTNDGVRKGNNTLMSLER